MRCQTGCILSSVPTARFALLLCFDWTERGGCLGWIGGAVLSHLVVWLNVQFNLLAGEGADSESGGASVLLSSIYWVMAAEMCSWCLACLLDLHGGNLDTTSGFFSFFLLLFFFVRGARKDCVLG